MTKSLLPPTCVCGNYCGEGYHVPREDVEPLAQRLVRCHGSVLAAGLAFSERHGLAPRSGERLLTRILNARVKAVKADTVDRLEVMI